MNALEIRYVLFKTLDATKDVDTVDMVSPKPGAPVALEITTSDGRTFVVSVKER